MGVPLSLIMGMTGDFLLVKTIMADLDGEISRYLERRCKARRLMELSRSLEMDSVSEDPEKITRLSANWSRLQVLLI